jgi:hypothetical protein
LHLLRIADHHRHDVARTGIMRDADAVEKRAHLGARRLALARRVRLDRLQVADRRTRGGCHAGGSAVVKMKPGA